MKSRDVGGESEGMGGGEDGEEKQKREVRHGEKSEKLQQWHHLSISFLYLKEKKRALGWWGWEVSGTLSLGVGL